MTETAPPPPRGFQGTFRTDPRARAAYAEGAGIYRVVPEAVAIPRTDEDVVALVSWARAERHTLTARGAGSAVSGSSVGSGVIVDLNQLGGAEVLVDPTTSAAVTRPGVTWGTLSEAAAAYGLRLPPDPSSGGFATLGGMVATNAAGARSLRYGSVRPWVQAVDLVTADGERVRLERGIAPPRCGAVDRFHDGVEGRIDAARDLILGGFPQTSKNTAGLSIDAYLQSGDLIDLIIGSEGTLGIITNIEWRLAPMPRHTAAMLVQLRDLNALVDVVSALSRLHPSAIELLDRTFLEVVPADQRPAGAAVLLVEFEGDDSRTLRGRVGDAVRAIEDRVDDIRTALSREEAETLWQLRHAASPTLAQLPDSRRSLQLIEDGCVPLERLTEYLTAIRRLAQKADIPVVIFGHAGDGHLHVNLLPDVSQPGWEEALRPLLLQVTDEVVRLGGTPAGEHGDGRLRAGLVERVYGSEIMALMRLVKDAFDPGHILNPGAIFTRDWDPVADLKAGNRATPLPDDIATALRHVERSASYGIPRLHLADGN